MVNWPAMKVDRDEEMKKEKVQTRLSFLLTFLSFSLANRLSAEERSTVRRNPADRSMPKRKEKEVRA